MLNGAHALGLLARDVHFRRIKEPQFMIQTPSSPSSQDEGKAVPSIYERRDAERQLNSIRRGHRVLTAMCVLFALLIGGAIWYEYPVLVDHKAELIRLPGLLQGVDAIGEHLRQTDAQIAAWSRQRDLDRESVSAQMAKLSRDVRTGMAAASRNVRATTDAAYTRIETRVNDQMDRIDTRLSSLETKRDADQKQIAALQQELTRVRQDLSQQTDKVASLEQQVQQNQAGAVAQISSLQSEQTRGQQELNGIQNQLAVDKVPFEARKGQDREIASGISLHISKTDASRGRVDGWVALQPGQPSITLRHQSIQEPLVFYGLQDGKRCELVITSVARNSVSGYLLVPKPRQADSGE